MAQERLVVKIDGDSKGLRIELEKADGSLTKFDRSMRASSNNMNRFSKGADSIGKSFRNAVASIAALQTTFFALSLTVGALAKSVISVNAEYEKMSVLLKNLSTASTEAGKAMEAKKSQQYIWDLAENSPFALESLTDSFVKFKTAGIDPTDGSLKALVDSVAAFGGSSEQLKRASVAIQQMAGKGVISMEELRQQLGEAVPDAMQLMSSAMNMTMKDFVKEVSQGTVAAGPAIQKMLAEMNRIHGGAAASMMNTWSGLIARMQTAYQKFIINVNNANDNGFFKALKQQLTDLVNFLNTKQGMSFAVEVSEGLATIVKGIADAIRWLYTYREEIVATGKVLIALWAGAKIYSAMRSFGGLFLNVVGLITGGNKNIIGSIGAVITNLRLFTAAITGSTEAAMILSMRGSALVGILNSLRMASLSNIASLAGMAARFGLVAGAAAAAAGAILMVANAIWQRNAAESRSAEIKKANKNGTLVDENKLEEHKNWLLSERERVLKKVAAAQDYANRFPRDAFGQEQLRKAKEEAWKLTQQIREYKKQATSLKDDQTKSASMKIAGQLSDNTNAVVAEIRRRAAIREQEIKNSSMSEEEKVKAIDKSRDDEMRTRNAAYEIREKQLLAIIARGQKQRNAAMVAGANQELENVRSMRQQVIKGQEAFDAPNVTLTDPKKGKEKAAKSDGLDGLRSRLINLRVETERLKAEANGTIDTFDDWSTEEPIRANVELIANEKELRDAIGAATMANREWKKEIKNNEALKDLKATIKDQGIVATEAFATMSKGYNTVIYQVERYNEKLKEKYKDQLADSKVSAQFQTAIEEATAEKRKELLFEGAAAAKRSTEQINEMWMTQEQIRERDFQREKERILELMYLNSGKTKAELEAVQELTTYLEALENKNRFDRLGPLGKWALEARDLKGNLASSMTGMFDGFLNDLVEGEASFKKFAKSLIVEITKIIIRALIAKAVLSAIGMGGSNNYAADGRVPIAAFNTNPTFGGGPNADGTISFAGNHGGGLVGRERSFNRNLDARILGFAKRFHGGGFPGLKDDEVPTILQKGEGVFTPEQMKALGNGKGGSSAPVTEVNIINQSGTQMDAQKGKPHFNGEKWVVDIILKNASQPGPMRDMLKGIK